MNYSLCNIQFEDNGASSCDITFFLLCVRRQQQIYPLRYVNTKETADCTVMYTISVLCHMVLKENNALSTLIYAIDKTLLILEGPLSVNLDTENSTLEYSHQTLGASRSVAHSCWSLFKNTAEVKRL